MSVSHVEDFVTKLVTGEYYIDPNAHNNPRQSARLEELENALFYYRVQKTASAVLSHHVVEDILHVIASARAARVIITGGEGGESSKKQPDKSEENTTVEFLRFSEKQPPSGGSVYNNNIIQGNVGNVVYGNQTINNTIILEKAVKEIEDA